MSVNIAELQASMTHIIDHPEEWNQEKWVCGSAACFAGRGLLNNGYQVFYDSMQDRNFASKGGTSADVADAAAALYGITQLDAKILFSPNNTLDALQEMVKDLANGEELAKHWTYRSAPSPRGSQWPRSYRWERLPEGMVFSPVPMECLS